MKVKLFLKLLALYVGAGAVQVMYEQWPWQGHAHVPFSSFPGFLVMSPIAPIWELGELTSKGPTHFIESGLWLFFLIFGLGLFFLFKKRSPEESHA
jgi:hypothetical protein